MKTSLRPRYKSTYKVNWFTKLLFITLILELVLIASSILLRINTADYLLFTDLQLCYLAVISVIQSVIIFYKLKDLTLIDEDIYKQPLF